MFPWVILGPFGTLGPFGFSGSLGSLGSLGMTYDESATGLRDCVGQSGAVASIRHRRFITEIHNPHLQRPAQVLVRIQHRDNCIRGLSEDIRQVKDKQRHVS